MKEFTSIEDAPHPFDSVCFWPLKDPNDTGHKVHTEGWKWIWFGGDWILSNGTVGLTRNDWEKYCNKKDAAKPHIPATREEVMALVDTWPTDWNKSGEKIIDDWIWAVLGGSPVIINQTDNVNSNTVITESEWREYKNQPLGTKADEGKVMMGAIPPHAELAVARVLTFGAKKYSRGNWAHVDNSDERYMDAALRHINAYRRGEQTDSETGENHLAHAVCCLMFMLDKSERSDHESHP